MGMHELSSHREDAVLVARAQAGDQAAFRQLFEAYSPLVYRIAYRMLGEAEEAADLTQDIFVRAYQRLASLRDGQAFHAWITRMAVNYSHDRLRRRRPTPLSLDAPPPGTGDGTTWEIPAVHADVEASLLASELTAQVENALRRLSPEHRAVVVLHHLEALPVDEIAGLLDLPTGTVKSRLSRARAELKRALAGYFEA